MSISSLCGSGMPTAGKTTSKATPRVLYVATSRNDGGLERYSVQMAACFAADGTEIRFACAPGEIVETLCRASGIETLPLTTRNSADWECVRTLADQIVRHAIDIVHVHSRRDYVTATLAVTQARRCLQASGRRPKLILHAHMLRPLGAPPGLSGQFFRWGADAVLANSNTVRDLLIERHHLPRSFVHLLHNGVALDRFAAPGSPQASRQRMQTRQEWAIPEDAAVLGMIGRLDAKGQRSLLEAVPELVREHPALHVVLIGSDGEPGEGARLKALAQAGGFADRLVLTGPREDVPALLPALDVLVHLPTDESFGLALTEAMAAGLPTVATDIGGCREVVQPGVTGFLVAPGDAAALENAIGRLLEAEFGPAKRREMGQAGRSAVEEQFSQEQQIQQLRSLYDAVTSLHHAPESGGSPPAMKRAHWTAATLALAAVAGGIFAHSHPRHALSRPAEFPIFAMRGHASHLVKMMPEIPTP